MMRLYRILLRLLPSSFRAEYGREMSEVFAEERRAASGLVAVSALWTRTLADLASNACRLHVDILRQDLQYTIRTMVRAPGFAATVILVTALGIGATTAAFSITNHVLIRPLPFPESRNLVKLWQDQSYRGYRQMELSPGNYRDWERASTSFDNLAAYTNRSSNLSGSGEPERLDGALTTWDLFEVLRVGPVMGRAFSEADDAPGAPGTVILSDGLWRSSFGADPGVIGRTVLLDNEPHAIIGVMPRAFYFPTRNTEFWRPLRFPPAIFEDRTDTFLYVIGRLRQGVTLDAARAEMTVVAGQLARAYPEANARTGAFIHRLQDQVSDRSRLMLTALVGASLCVLLIACINLGNLLLSRALSRGRELAVRRALGAGAERLVRQMLTESLVLAAVGGVAGVAIAHAATPLVAQLVPTALPISDVPGIDYRVLLFAGLTTGAAGVGFGLAPALRARRDVGMTALRSDARVGASRRTHLFRSALVVAEVTASVVLLVCAGLLVRALWQVQQIDPGFRTDGVLTMRTALPFPKYAPTARRQQFYDRVLAEVEALPGVSKAAYISFLPMVWRGGIWPVTEGGRTPDPTDTRVASLRLVTPGFFSTLGIPILQGRDVQPGDTEDAPDVAVVSQSFARLVWPGEDPLGRRFFVAFRERTIVGVVGDIRVRGLERSDSEPQVYVPSTQVPDGGLPFYAPKDLVIRAIVPPDTIVPAVRQIISRVDPLQPVSDVRPLADIVSAETGPREVQLRALGGFALLAFVLAALGIHGLLAYHVSTQLREIGVRVALGAPVRAIVALVGGRAVLLTGAGIVLGLGLAWMAGTWLGALLAGVSPRDPLTFGTAAALSLVMAAIGSLAPVARALRVDPLVALKEET
jgi:putative ABC transport system permease protein